MGVVKSNNMSAVNGVKQAIRKVTGRSGPRLLVVKQAWYLTPNMIRVTFAGPELAGFPEGREGGNCKLLLPEPDENRGSFVARLTNDPAPERRTYTVRNYRADVQELDIDFVAHGDSGPASYWAMHAQPGHFLGLMGPSAPKLTEFNADWYLIAADPSAIPMAAATLEMMPRDAIGVAVFEVTSIDDQQTIDAPEGIDIHWLVHADRNVVSEQQENFIRRLDWPEGRVQTCIAGESLVIRSLKTFLSKERMLPRENTYISGYWKIGMVEDEHQKFKRSES